MEADYSMPRPCGLSPRAIIDLAEKIALDFQDNTGRVAVSQLVERLNGSVEYVDIWKAGIPVNEAIVVDGPGDFKISISDSSLIHFRNFSIAHELGHYILHFLWNRKSDSNLNSMVAFMNREDEVTEHEANLFASALLMPTSDVMATTSASDSPVVHYSVSEKFSVPLKNAEIWCKAIQDRLY